MATMTIECKVIMPWWSNPFIKSASYGAYVCSVFGIDMSMRIMSVIPSLIARHTKIVFV